MNMYRPWYFDSRFWLIFFADRITKQWALSACKAPVVVIRDWITLRLAFNRGVSWSLFHTETFWGFFILSTAIFFVLAFLAKHTLDEQRQGKEVIGNILVLAGGFANFSDRISTGAVVDFIAVAHGTWAFPVFNIADIAVTSGICLMVYALLQGDAE